MPAYLPVPPMNSHLPLYSGCRRLGALVSGEDLSTIGGSEGFVSAIAAGCQSVIHAHRTVEHPVRVVEFSDGENVDGKTVTFVCWSAAKIEFLHRAFVDIGHASTASGENARGHMAIPYKLSGGALLVC